MGREAGPDARGIRAGRFIRVELLVACRSGKGCVVSNKVTTSWFLEAMSTTGRSEWRPDDAKEHYRLLLRRYSRLSTMRRGALVKHDCSCEAKIRRHATGEHGLPGNIAAQTA